MKYHEAAVGLSSEWRTPPSIIEPIGLTYGFDPCAPVNGYCCVEATVRFTVHDNGLTKSWAGLGIGLVNPPWSEKRRAVVGWLCKFFAEADGGIFICVARTSADWFQEIALARAELICLPATKTRFYRADGTPGPEPTNGIALIGKGEIACAALRRSRLGYCINVDRTAAPPARASTGRRP